MRKSMLALAATGSLFTLTAAAAGSLTTTGGTSVSVTNSKVVSVSTTDCKDSIAVDYVWGNADHDTITAVTLTGAAYASSTCKGMSVKVTLGDGTSVGSSNHMASQTGTFSATSSDGGVADTATFVTLTFGTPFDVHAYGMRSTSIWAPAPA